MTQSRIKRTYAKLRWLGCSEEFIQHVAYSRNKQCLVRPARVESKTEHHLYGKMYTTKPTTVLPKPHN